MTSLPASNAKTVEPLHRMQEPSPLVTDVENVQTPTLMDADRNTVAISTPQDVSLIPILAAQDLPIATSEQQVMPPCASLVAHERSTEEYDLSRGSTADLSSCESVTDRLTDQGSTSQAQRAHGTALRTHTQKINRATNETVGVVAGVPYVRSNAPPPPVMEVPSHSPENTYTVGTLNINGLYAGNKLRMLNEFIIRHDIGMRFLQEVVTVDFYPIPGYTIHINIEAERRGIAIVIRDSMPLDDVGELLSGRGIAGRLHQITIINLYAPSGSNNRHD
jgi:hypothetical protein